MVTRTRAHNTLSCIKLIKMTGTSRLMASMPIIKHARSCIQPAAYQMQSQMYLSLASTHESSYWHPL